jgi:hypothetical protein
MKNLKTFEDFVNESKAIKELENTVNETLSFVNEAAPVLTPEVAKETKEALKKVIDGMKDTPEVDDKTKVNLVKSGIALAIIDAIAEKFGDRPATEDAKVKMRNFMTKVNSARSLDEVQKVVFDVVDYALELAQETK